MLNLVKVVAALFLVLGAGAYLMKQPLPGDGSGSGSFTLFKDLGSGAKPEKPRKAKGPDGIVIDHVDGALVVLPWTDGGPVQVRATAKQRSRCPMDARYPDCL